MNTYEIEINKNASGRVKKIIEEYLSGIDESHTYSIRSIQDKCGLTYYDLMKLLSANLAIKFNMGKCISCSKDIVVRVYKRGDIISHKVLKFKLCNYCKKQNSISVNKEKNTLNDIQNDVVTTSEDKPHGVDSKNFSFSLCKRIDKQIDFNKTFKLKNSVYFEKGVNIRISGRELDDGSFSISMAPIFNENIDK